MEIERTRYAPVPGELTSPLVWPDVPARPLYADDLERLARAYAAELARADADRACLRALQRLTAAGPVFLLSVPAECGQTVDRP